MTHQENVLNFWFNELSPKDWYSKDKELDRSIRDKYLELHHAAVQGELWQWRNSPVGALAEIIVIDQFSRNMFRDTPEAFAYDGIALVLAQNAVSLSWHRALKALQRPFLLMPYMHSESVMIHEQAVKLFNAPGLMMSLEYEYKHKAIIDKFGRYPHRNEILGRHSTPEELAFLNEADSSF